MEWVRAPCVRAPCRAQGVAAMRVKRDARALEEAIATGMVQSKGLGKKKRAEQGEALQRTA